MSTVTKRFVSVGLSVTTAVWLSGAALLVPVASAQTTVADLTLQIQQLLALVANLQAQLNTVQGGGSSVGSSYNFTRDLTLGSKGDDVKALQQWLNAQGFAVAASGAGSVGNESTYFGSLTQGALAKWQAANGVSPAVGYFGPITRAKIASMGGGTTTGGGTPVVSVPAGTDLVVSMAADSPTGRTIGSGTAFNKALKVNLTAGAKAVKITSITVQKSGFVANSNLNGVDIIDSTGMRHGNVITSINADNTILITMVNDPIMVGAGSTQTITVRFNLLTGNYNGTVSFSIASASSFGADTTAISGSFPFVGATHNIVNGGTSLASTTLDVLTSTGSSTLNVDAGSLQEITRFRIQETGSNEGAYLHSLTLYNYENAATNDYGSVTLEDQTGAVLAVGTQNGKYVTFALLTPYFIDKGLTKDFVVKAKLLDGTTRKINFVVFDNYDIDLRGASTGVSVIPGPGTNDTSFPIGNGFNIQTIGSGSMTLTRASDSPSSSVVPGATNVVLVKYNAKPTGENYELRQVSFYIATSTTAGTAAVALTGTVLVKVNGQIVYSVGASSVSKTTASTFTLSSYPILTAGQDSVITIEASINSTAGTNDNYTVKSFDLVQAKRLVTNDILDPGVGAVDGLQIGVQAAKLTVTTLSTPNINSVVAGTVGYEYATFELSAEQGGEDAKITKITITHSGGTAGEVTNLLMYKDSDTSPLSTTASTATNGATVAFNFASPIVVTRTAKVKLHLKADATSGTDAHTFAIASSTSAVTATGASTGNTLTNGTDITFAGPGQAQTHVTAGTLTLSIVSGANASPTTNDVVNVGTSNKVVFAFKMTSQYETQKITSLKLTATSSGSTSLATSTLKNLALREGSPTASPVATAAQFDSCAAGTCTITFTATENVFSAAVPTTGLTVYVTADVQVGGVADIGNSYKFLIASSTADVAVKGTVTGSTSGTKTGTPTASGFVFVVPQSVVIEAVSPTSATQVGLTAGQNVGVFKITNSGSAPVYVTSTATFSNGGSATTSVTFNLYGSAVGGTQSDTTVTYATTSTSGGATGASSSIPFGITTGGATEANRTIDGGSWRYLTIKTSGTAANNDSFQFSVSALGNLLFYVKESDLGYSGNPSSDSDLSDTIDSLYVDGKPSLSTVTAKT